MPETVPQDPTAAFAVKPEGDPQLCWGWTGLRFFGNRAPAVVVGDEVHTARFAKWRSIHGAPPSGMVVRQVCGSTDCLNPLHLALGRSKNKTRATKGQP